MSSTGSSTSTSEAAQAARDDQAEGAALQLLEILQSLSVVYESAEYFAEVVGDKSIADYTLMRSLDAIDCSVGAIYFAVDREFELQAERHGASQLLEPKAIDIATRGALFRNGHAAKDYLVPVAHGRSFLYAPITAGERKLGALVILGDDDRVFTTTDAKLIAAVTSQAAIALSSAWHYRAVAIERSKLRSIIEDNRAGIIVLSPTGQTVLCNSVARGMFGIAEEVAEGSDFPTILSEWRCQPGTDVFRHGEDTIEISRGSGDTERVLGIRSSAVRGAEDEVVNIVLTIQDLTEKRREERLKRDFLSLISHKLRTPLTGIVGSLAMLEDESLGDLRVEVLGEANTRTDELSRLVDRLLLFAEIMDGSWSSSGRCDITIVREEVQAQLIKRYEGSALELSWDIAPDCHEFALPASRFRVLLDSVLDNAIKFSLPEKPVVQVSARRDEQGAILLRVEDRGPGIPPESRESIFESCYQHEADFTGNVQGVGIGLPIVVEILRRVGGSISVEDAQPHGAVITMRFPRKRP